MSILDALSQALLVLLGPLAVFLAGRKNRWGFAAGLAGEPAWFITTAYHRQWGIFALNFVYLGTWGYGTYTWFRRPAPTREHDR